MKRMSIRGIYRFDGDNYTVLYSWNHKPYEDARVNSTWMYPYERQDYRHGRLKRLLDMRQAADIPIPTKDSWLRRINPELTSPDDLALE